MKGLFTPLQYLALLLHSSRSILFGTSGVLLGLIPAASIIYHMIEWDVAVASLSLSSRGDVFDSTCQSTADVLKFGLFDERRDAEKCITTIALLASQSDAVKSHGRHHHVVDDFQSELVVGSDEDEEELAVGASIADGYSVTSGAKGKDLNGCRQSTGRTCRLFACDKWAGATECINGECICKPGYCSDRFGTCRGCGHFTMEIHDALPQHNKAGYYSAISGFSKAGRPVWKQFHGENWVWYCQQHSCWVASDVAPNDFDCSSGVVSARSFRTATPFDLSERGWKFWNGFAWIDNFHNYENGNILEEKFDPKPHLHLRCQDFRLPGAGLDDNFPSGRNSVTRSP